MYPKQILDALAHVRYPGTGKTLIEAQMVADNIRIEGNNVSFSIIFEKENDPFMRSVIKAATTAINTYVPEAEQVDITPQLPIRKEVPKYNAMANVKNIIAVSSGKGGVGKSTVAANLAMALKNKGYKVGLLDADIFGPSMPKMFAIEDVQPYGYETEEGQQLIEPIEQYGIKILSIGFFVNTDNAIIWRGGMASNAIKQLINEAHWGELDYFIIDMPPGTSDIHLTLVDALKITGAIVVSTPQAVALADAIRGLQMFENENINIPVLGLVENMAWFTPAEHPTEKYFIFGNGGCKALAEQRGIELLAQIPLVKSICECGDAGAPIAFDPYSLTGQVFNQLAQKVVDATNK